MAHGSWLKAHPASGLGDVRTQAGPGRVPRPRGWLGHHEPYEHEPVTSDSRFMNRSLATNSLLDKRAIGSAVASGVFVSRPTLRFCTNNGF